jgi:hypothetical protein
MEADRLEKERNRTRGVWARFKDKYNERRRAVRAAARAIQPVKRGRPRKQELTEAAT